MKCCNCGPHGGTLIADRYDTVERAVNEAANQAVSAYCQGTFSVGGVMLDSAGKVLHALHNNVVVDGMTYDPTAHGERQLIDWYYEQIAAGEALPAPADITIVTSLDPCCMCSGAILSAGFKVVAAAFDNHAGIDFDMQADFPSLAPALVPVAQSTFSYPAVNGDDCFAREATSAPVPDFFVKKVINHNTQALCRSIFDSTVQSVQNTINGNDVAPEDLLDPATLPEDDPIIVALKAIYPQALSYKAPTPHAPDVGLAQYLLDAANIDKQQGGKGSSVALLDAFGNLLLCLPGNQANSLIKTPFMLTTRAYAELRHALRQSEGQRVLSYLGHPKYCTFIMARGHDTSALSLADLGAYGSTMEGALAQENPCSLTYVVPSIDQASLAAYCKNLPPLYSKTIGVMPVQITDQELIDKVTEGLPR